MIFTASLNTLKKVYNSSMNQSSIEKIISLIPLEPKVSTMDILVLSPSDFSGLAGNKLVEALKLHHEKLRILYFYMKDKDVENISNISGIEKIRVSKLSNENLKPVIDDMIAKGDINGKKVIISNDTITPELKEPESFSGGQESIGAADDEEIYVAQEEINCTPADVKDSFTEHMTEIKGAVDKMDFPVVPPIPNVPNATTIEERVTSALSYANYDFIKKQMAKDSIVKALISENTKFAGALQMLDVLDRQITATYNDRTISQEAKMERIKQLGLERSSLKGETNNLIVEKVSSIMTTIVATQTEAVESKISIVKKSLDSICAFQTTFKNQDLINTLVKERLNIQLELMETVQKIIESYRAMDDTVTDYIETMDFGLPSENAYINEMTSIIKPLFVPQNAASLISKLMTDLQTNRVKYSGLELSINSLVGCIFKLCDVDNSIIGYQKKMIELLKAQRVEDIIVINEALKNYTRVFIGGDSTGVTTTATMYAAIQSRKSNTLLIDMRSGNKLCNYGKTVYDLDTFFEDKIQEELTFVNADINSLEEANLMFQKLTPCLAYYKNIVLMMDDTFGPEVVNECSQYLLTIHYIVDSSLRSIELTKHIRSRITAENIATKVIMIAPVLDAIEMADRINIDLLTVKAICIPLMPIAQLCTLKHLRPWDYEEMRIVYSEAFA